MREGGIFDLPSALGIEVAMSDAVTNMDSCNLSGLVKSDAALWLQKLMIEKGASSLKADGIWGGCSESAFVNLFGVRTSPEALSEKTGLTCSNIIGYPGAPFCKDGTDAVFEQLATSQPAPKLVARIAPELHQVTSASPLKAMLPKLSLAPVAPTTASDPGVPQVTMPLERSYTWLYVLLGLAAVGGVAYVLLRKKKAAPALAASTPSAAPAVMNRRRRHPRIRMIK